MKSLWERAASTVQNVATNVSAVLDTLDGETGLQKVQLLKEELGIYKTLLDEAQMQNVEMSKQTQLLLAEKEAEITLWIEKCNGNSSIKTTNEAAIDEPSLDVAKLKAEKKVIETMMAKLEEKLRDSVRDINESKIIKMKFNDLTSKYDNLKSDYDELIERDKERADTIENLVAEYSKLAADSADVKQGLDNQRVSDSQRLIEVLKENEILVTKMHALEHNITEFADRATMETHPSTNSDSSMEELKEIRNRVVNLQFDIKDKDKTITTLNAQLVALQNTTPLKNKPNDENEKRLQIVTNELSGLRDDVTRLKTEKREAEDAGRTLTEQLKRIQKQFDDLKEDMNEKGKVETAIFDNIDATITNLKQQLTDSEQQVKLLTEEKQIMEASLNKYKLLEEDLSSQMSTITNLKQQLADSEQQVKLLTEEKQIMEASLNKYKLLEEDLSSQMLIIRSLEQSIENEKQQIDLVKQKAEMDIQKATFEERKRSEETCVKRLEEQAEIYENKIKSTLEEMIQKYSKEKEDALAQQSANSNKDKEDALSQAEETFTSMMVEAEAQNVERMKQLEEQYKSLISTAEASAAQAKADLSNVEGRWVLKIKQDLAALEKKKNLEIITSVKAKEEEMMDKVNNAENSRKEFLALYTKESKLRKSMHNKLIELQGNIRVICRVRPILEVEREQGKDSDVTNFPAGNEDIIITKEGTKTRYEYDQVFPPNSTQLEVFDAYKELCVSVLDGYNVCIFAYGQTGSGKTYTMEGSKDDPGISPLAIAELFNVIAGMDNWSYQLTLSMLEIYNETILDLIETSNEKLDIRQGSEGNMVVGLTEVEITNFDEVKQLMALGNKNRAVGAHDMNKHSSRSHSILTVSCRGKNVIDNESSFGKLHLIDLAGSERVSKTDAQGDRLKEAQNINRSLSALGDVISALGNKKSTHIPFRNSKLTFLLQDSLGGNSKVCMCVNISPAVYNISETVCSLNFASRCRSVELGQAKKNQKGDSKDSKDSKDIKKYSVP